MNEPRATGMLVHPFLFNTGEIPKFTMEFASPTSFYNPTFVNTQEIEGSVRLNNINYKIDNNQQINAFDVLDLIWMPKYRWDRDAESVVVELVDIYNNIIVDKGLLQYLRKSLVLWAEKYVLDENNIEKVIRGLKMSSHEVIDLKRDIGTARIDSMWYRTEMAAIEAGIDEVIEASKEAGREEGIAEEKLETARKMLDMEFPIEKIVEITGLSENDILNEK